MEKWADWVEAGARLPGDWAGRWRQYWGALRAASGLGDERQLVAGVRRQLEAMNCPSGQWVRLIERLREDEGDSTARLRLQRLLTGIWNALVPAEPIDPAMARRHGMRWPLFARDQETAASGEAAWVPTPEELSHLAEIVPGARLADVLGHLQGGEGVGPWLGRLRERIGEAAKVDLGVWRALVLHYRDEAQARAEVDRVIDGVLGQGYPR